MLPESSPVVRCSRCEAFLWLDLLEPVGQVPWLGIDDRANQGLDSSWIAAPAFNLLGKDDLAQALDDGVGDTPARERHLRIQYWWALNDVFRRQNGIDRPPDSLFRRNLQRLTELLGNDSNDLLLRAEVAREMGQFEAASTLCDEAIRTNSEKYLTAIANAIKARAVASDSTVFEL
jgi:hypothetical protein